MSNISPQQFDDIKELRQEQMESLIATAYPSVKLEAYVSGRTKPRLSGNKDTQYWTPYYGVAILAPQKPILTYNLVGAIQTALQNFGFYLVGFTAKGGKVPYLYFEAYDGTYIVLNPDWKAPVNNAQALNREIANRLASRPPEET